MSLVAYTTNDSAKVLNFYYDQVRKLEITEPYLDYMNDEGKSIFANNAQLTYNIFYDRVITSNLNFEAKREIEDWYQFYREFVGFLSPTELNSELEKILIEHKIF